MSSVAKFLKHFKKETEDLSSCAVRVKIIKVIIYAKSEKHADFFSFYIFFWADGANMS